MSQSCSSSDVGSSQSPIHSDSTMTANVARPIPQRQPSTPTVARSMPQPIPMAGRRRRSTSGSSNGSPRSSSLSAFIDSRFLGSCATTTPFSFLEEEEEREEEGLSSSPPLASSLPRPSSSPPSPGPKLSGSPNSPPPAARPPPAATTNGTNTPARRPSKRWHRLFDFDHVLGALDPAARLASATAPDPIPIVVFGAETEEGIAVCRSLLAARCWALVALMVDDDCKEAAELREAGVPVVQVDMDDPGTYRKYLSNKRGVYLSTNGEFFRATLSLSSLCSSPSRARVIRIPRYQSSCHAAYASLRDCNDVGAFRAGHAVFGPRCSTVLVVTAR